MPYKDKEKQLEHQRRFYHANKKKVQGWVKRRHDQLNDLIADIKADAKCKVCGENHPACLVFRHRNPEEKSANISCLGKKGWSKERILEEIAKCDVYCSNCHLKLHWDNDDIPGPWV